MTTTQAPAADRTLDHVARLVAAAERIDDRVEARYGVGIVGGDSDQVWAATDGKWEARSPLARLDDALGRLGVHLVSLYELRECCQCQKLLDDSNVYRAPESVYSFNLGGDVCAECLDDEPGLLESALVDYVNDPDTYLPASITSDQLTLAGFDRLDLLDADELAAVGLGELDPADVTDLYALHTAWGPTPSDVVDLVTGANPGARVVFVDNGDTIPRLSVNVYVRTVLGPWGPLGW